MHILRLFLNRKTHWICCIFELNLIKNPNFLWLVKYSGKLSSFTILLFSNPGIISILGLYRGPQNYQAMIKTHWQLSHFQKIQYTQIFILVCCIQCCCIGVTGATQTMLVQGRPENFLCTPEKRRNRNTIYCRRVRFFAGQSITACPEKIDCPCNRSVPFKFSFLGHRVYGGLIHSVHFFPRSDRYGTEAPEIPGTTVAFGPRAGKKIVGAINMLKRGLYSQCVSLPRERKRRAHTNDFIMYYMKIQGTKNNIYGIKHVRVYLRSASFAAGLTARDETWAAATKWRRQVHAPHSHTRAQRSATPCKMSLSFSSSISRADCRRGKTSKTDATENTSNAFYWCSVI